MRWISINKFFRGGAALLLATLMLSGCGGGGSGGADGASGADGPSTNDPVTGTVGVVITDAPSRRSRRASTRRFA